MFEEKSGSLWSLSTVVPQLSASALCRVHSSKTIFKSSAAGDWIAGDVRPIAISVCELNDLSMKLDRNYL